MSTRITELGIKVTSDVDRVAADFDQVASSATGMGDAVERAGRDADTASDRMSRVSDSADNMDDKAGRATGALGALSAGFELAGAEEYAAGLQGAAMATDFLSGVGQSLNLVMELQVVATARAKAAAIAHRVATVAQSAATRAAAVAQWAMNAAMSANPVGLLIAAVLVVVGLFVLLYRRSERFRAIVQAVMRAAATATGWVVDWITRLLGWVGRLVSQWADAWGTIWDKARDVYEKLKLGVATVRDKVGEVAAGIRSKLVDAFNAAKAPVEWLLEKVQWLLDKMGSLPGAGALFGRTTTTTTPTATAGDSYYFDLSGVVTSSIDDLVALIVAALAERNRRIGGTVV